MAIAFRAVSYGETPLSGGNPLVIDTPSGTTYGEVMLAVIQFNNGTHEFPTCSGWTCLSTGEDSTGNKHRALFYRRAPSDGTSYSFVFANDVMSQGAIVSYSGCTDLATFIDDYSDVEYVENDGTLRAASIDTIASSEMLVFLGLSWFGSNTYSSSPPTDFTERYDRGHSNLYQCLCISDYTQASAGSSGAKDATLASTTTAKHAWLVGLLPPGVYGIGAIQFASPTLGGAGHGNIVGAGALQFASPALNGTACYDIFGGGALQFASPTIGGSMWMDSAHLRHLGGKAMLWGAKGRAEIRGLKGKASM